MMSCCNSIIYTSKVFKCPKCKSTKFITSGKTCCDESMHEGDEVECLSCSKLGEVDCDDGCCHIAWWSK